MNHELKTKFLLDSGDPNDYQEIIGLAKKADFEIWGATTNPSLIAKKLVNKKPTFDEAFELQRQIVMEIVELVPGAVSAEVYADENTSGENMARQGLEIANWSEKVVVKLPTTIEGFKARAELRKNGVSTNNTLVFSQEQIFAICLHEKLVQKTFNPPESKYPPFISPFVGRLDDVGENGMDLIKNGMKVKALFENVKLWMLEASVRRTEHLKKGMEVNSELITAPGKVYREWFGMTKLQRDKLNANDYANELKPINYWQPQPELLAIDSLEALMAALESGQLNIQHPLTDKGLIRFAEDWRTILI